MRMGCACGHLQARREAAEVRNTGLDRLRALPVWRTVSGEIVALFDAQARYHVLSEEAGG